jgi:seryl-tRNA synthetase
MLDIKVIRDNPEQIQENCRNRHVDVDISRLLELDAEVKAARQEIDVFRTERNANADALKNTEDKKGADAQELIARGKELKTKIATLEDGIESTAAELQTLLMQVPNLTHPDSPLGKDDSENKELRVVGERPQFDFKPKDHVTIGEEKDLIDFERAAEASGSGFYYLKNESALLELGLVNYAVNVCRNEGFKPMITPDLARQEVLEGTGFNPRGDETQIYTVEGQDLSLVATAEITVAGYYRNHTFKKGELDEPKKIVAMSHCFRTEAGAYGRESKGLYRVHQFTKVEMFVFCKPEESARMHDELLAAEEKIMQGLEIPYRVVDICTGDLGGPAYRKYDLEAWMPFRDDWGEVTSTSNCTDYQSRRLNIKYENDEGKKELVHTLNGTAIVGSRVPICILENFQQKDGSIDIPQALHPYMFGVQKIS